VETDALKPLGIYGWSIVTRESSFRTTALNNPEQKLCFYRLMYAQHLCYGVLVDLARLIMEHEPISLGMPAVNLISQRDANEVAIRALLRCTNDPWLLNVAGPVVPVRSIAKQLGNHLRIKPIFLEDEGDTALVASDAKCLNTFGPYRDSIVEMIEAAAAWVKKGGTSWNKPTLFGKVKHNY
jgi:hypothetical protein